MVINHKSEKIKCCGVSNVFLNDEKKRIFFNEYDNWDYYEMLEEMKFLATAFEIDIYLFKSSLNHYHLVSFDIIDIDYLKAIIDSCTNDGDYLYNFWDKNHEYVLRLSEKGLTLPPFFELFINGDKKLKRSASSQHIKIYKLLTKTFLPIPENKKIENLITKIVVYNTNRRQY